MSDILKRAVLELGIDVPVMRATAGPAGTVTLHLYGGQILTWDPPTLPGLESVAPTPPGATATPVATVGVTGGDPLPGGDPGSDRLPAATPKPKRTRRTTP